MAQPTFRDPAMRTKLHLGWLLCLCLSPGASAWADEWCDLQSGWQIYTHGNSSNKVWIYGVFVGQTNSRWIQINNPEASTGASNVALAMAASVSGKRISVYLDSVQDTCATFPNWSAAIRHLRVLD